MTRLTIFQAKQSVSKDSSSFFETERWLRMFVFPSQFTSSAIFQDHKQFTRLGVIDDLPHPNNIGVIDLFENGNLFSNPAISAEGLTNSHSLIFVDHLGALVLCLVTTEAHEALVLWVAVHNLYCLNVSAYAHV